MADVNTRGTGHGPDGGTGPGTGRGPDGGTPAGRGTGGSTMILGLLVLAVLALVIWLVMRGGGDDADINVNVPQVEAPDVEVKSSGGSN
jgi:hypothetical protein